jgi:UDP-N-acetylglucosamine 3-dehydrogenase
LPKEEVWKEGKLIHRESRDKLRLMVESFLSGDFDHRSKDRALKNLELLENLKSMKLF